MEMGNGFIIGTIQALRKQYFLADPTFFFCCSMHCFNHATQLFEVFPQISIPKDTN